MAHGAACDGMGVSTEDEPSIHGMYQEVLHASVTFQEIERPIRKVTGDKDGSLYPTGKLLDNIIKEEAGQLAQEVQCQLGESLQAPRKLDFQEERVKKKLYAWKLKKDVRRLCNRLLWRGLHTVLPSVYDREGEPAGGEEPFSSSQDLLQDMDEKYDIVRQKLFIEMLQEQHGKASWEALLPWQQKERIEELEALAEHALNDAADPCCLCELPGAFRIYRSWDKVVLKSCPEEVNPSGLEWTAVFFLKELHTEDRMMKKTLALIMKSLDVAGLRLLSLHMKLAVMRANREKRAHGAMLAACQSWEKWPVVKNPHSEDLARFWLAEESPWETDSGTVTFSPSSQQLVLLCLLSVHEKERACLIQLLHSLTLEELLGQREQNSSATEDISEGLAALRTLGVTRLRQLKADLEGPLGPPTWGHCALSLMTHLMERQDAEVEAVMRALLGTNKDRLLALQQKYEAEQLEKKMINLFQLLLADSWPKASASDGDGAHASISERETETSKLHRPRDPISVNREDTGIYKQEMQLELSVNSEKRDLCIACGNALTPEDLPYLEILSKTNTEGQWGVVTKKEKEEMEKNDMTINLEKQGSLIAVAWSQTAQETSNSEAFYEATVNDGSELCLEQDQVNNDPSHEISEDMYQADEANCCLFQSSQQAGCSLHPSVKEDTSFEKLSDEDLVTLNPEIADRSGEVITDQAVVEGPALADDSACSACGGLSENSLTLNPEITDRSGEVITDQAVAEGPALADDSACSASGGLSENSLEHPVQGATSTDKVGSISIKREMTIVHISEMDKEETMKSLVDMQRKAEGKYKRDKKRQILRVQERLSIVQNKKSDEDLLGHKQTDGLKNLTENLKKEDRNRQKMLVKEKLEQLRRERSCVMQSKRDRNTAGFKELLEPIVLKRAELEDAHNSQS